MRIVIRGRIASKKNSKNVGRNKYTGKTFFTSSSAWKRFEQSALEQLLQHKDKFGDKLVRIEYTFITKGQETIDCDNAMAGFNDILQKRGIINDDKQIKQWSGFIVNGQKSWISILDIMEITDRWDPIGDLARKGVVIT